MLNPKTVYKPKSKRQKLEQKKEEKEEDRWGSKKVLKVKPIQIDSDGSYHDSKTFKPVYINIDNEIDGSKEYIKKESKEKSSKKELSPNKVNQFNYQKFIKKILPTSVDTDKYQKDHETGLEVIEDQGGINENENDAYRPFKFFVEGTNGEKNIRKIALKDRIRTCIAEAEKAKEQKDNVEVEKVIQANDPVQKDESEVEEKEEKKNRYFQVSHERCYRCGNEGHYAMNCIEEWNRKCKNCFSHDHEERSCPQICYKCGNIGHVSRDCTQSQDVKCQLCNKRGHTVQCCGSIIGQSKNMSKINEEFHQADLKKLKCIAPDHGTQHKKCNKFNCFEYRRNVPYPYDDLRGSSKRVQRVDLKDYLFDDQRRTNRYEASRYQSDRHSHNHQSHQNHQSQHQHQQYNGRERAREHYRSRFQEDPLQDLYRDRGDRRHDRGQNRSFGSSDRDRKQHNSHRKSDRSPRHIYY